MKKIVRRVRRIGLLGLVSFALLGAAVLCVPMPPIEQRDTATVVTDEDGRWLRLFASDTNERMLRIPVQRAELPEHLVDALIAFEDQRFYWHPGIDPIAVARAAIDNLRSGRIVSGASTVTMQVARMLDPRSRTFGAKAFEALRALKLELFSSKDEILALYFNLAPYGGNIEGIGAASYLYYGRPVEELTYDEAATLVAIPNAPSRLRPDRNPSALRRRRDQVLERMAEVGTISAEERDAAIRIGISAKRRPVPFLAPHFSEKLRREHPEQRRIVSTIDSSLQYRVEKLLSDHLSGLIPKGIENGAVVVLENDSRAVRAWVGSRAFFDKTIDGQVDGASSPRSPGSTLKPFVYALALDRGLIGTHELIEDVPLYYRDWAPRNFDGKWRGVVPVELALRMSLNIPAVRVAQKLEPDGLVAFLRRAGFERFQGDHEYGLAAVLGGCEVTLAELTNLYATLASGGLHRPIVTTRDQLGEASDHPHDMRLFGDGAAYLVSQILTDLRRPDLPDVWQDAISLPKIAWKTGTSYGRRDALSVGFNRRYTIGVWIGNFDGKGVPELVGVEAAAPLLFSIAKILPGANDEAWLDEPKSVATREVCPLSGKPRGPNCPHGRLELALTDVAPRDECSLHVAVDVDDESGFRLCSRCRQGHAFHKEVHVVWPSKVAAHLKENGGLFDRVPQHNPSCLEGLDTSAPQIIAPLDGDQFVMRPGVPTRLQQIALVGSQQSGAGRLHWFVDGAHLGTGTRVMFDPTNGSHRIVAVDDEGRSSAITIAVGH